MRRLACLLAALSVADAAHAQDHAGHETHPSAADPHAGHQMAPTPLLPRPTGEGDHAQHGGGGANPGPPQSAGAPAGGGAAESPDPHAGHQMAAPAPADPHAGHAMPAPAAPAGPAPPVPTDFEADRHFPAADMAAAREQLRREHGRIVWSKVMAETLEIDPGSGRYHWEGRASFGRDVERLVVKSRGEGDAKLERGEIDLLWGHAVSPWFNIETGVRRDLQSGGRTSAVLGIDGLVPYEFDVNASAFLSTKGELRARLEGSHDYRLTQRWILEPRAEAEFAAEDMPSIRIGSGLSRAEFGLRLRYAFTPAFAPYVGLEHERSFGRTADLVRAAGEKARETRFVIGLRAWF